MGFADVHAHLTHPRVEKRIEELISRAREVGITTIISHGLNTDDNRAVWGLSRRFPEVKPAFGLYPVEAVREDLPDLSADYPRHTKEVRAVDCVQWVRDHVDEAFAIGEIGLDGHWVPEALWEKQETAFRALISVALDARKPMVVHSRKREKRAMEIVRELGARKVLWHCFGGKLALAQEIADLGYYLSIPSHVRRAENFVRMLKGLPRDRILFETDCPYLGANRDQDSEPADVVQTAAFAAEVWKVSMAEVQNRIAENFIGLFSVDP